MTYRITHRMTNAGIAAMEQCAALGNHTAATACQAIFTAMLHAADHRIGPDIRRSFIRSDVTQSRPPIDGPLQSYAGLTIGDYTWRGFDYKHRLHYFQNGVSELDWIRLTKPDWHAVTFERYLKEGVFRADAIIVNRYMKKGVITKP